MNILNHNRTRPYISVIIPCLNEELYIVDLLDDLTRQKEFTDFEVIVVDSNSSDNTAGVAQKFTGKLPLRVLRLTKSGVALARNQGAAAAKGQFLLFLDADLKLPTNFLSLLAKESQDKNADMMTTHFRASGWHPVDRFLYFADSMVFRLMFLRKTPLMTGCVMFVSKELHRKVGGFNEELTLGEDVDYSRRIANVSKAPRFVAKIKVTASNRRFKRDGRLHMIGWHWQWVTNRRFPFRNVDKYDFGHYHSPKDKPRQR